MHTLYMYSSKGSISFSCVFTVFCSVVNRYILRSKASEDCCVSIQMSTSKQDALCKLEVRKFTNIFPIEPHFTYMYVCSSWIVSNQWLWYKVEDTVFYH